MEINFRFSRVRHWMLTAFILISYTASAQLVINEVRFNGASEPGDEFVEIYNSGGSSVVMTNYTLTNQDVPFSYTFPAFTLNAGAYVVVNMGTGTDTATNLFAGEGAAVLNNTGDDVLLSNDSATALDYIAYGTGASIDSPPGGITWGADIGISGVAVDDSIALLPTNSDINDGANWLRRSGGNVTPGAANPQQSDPTVTFDAITTNPASACADTQVDLTVTNTDEAAIADVQLVVTVPADYYFISATLGGIYNSVAHTISWNLGTIAAGGNASPELHIQPDCTAASAQTLAADVSWRRYVGESNPKQSITAVNSAAITVNAAGVTVTIEDFANPGSDVIWQELTKTVNFKITVAKTGPGTHPGVAMTHTMGTGLKFVVLKNDNASGLNVAFTKTVNVFTWTTDPIPSGGEEVFFFQAKVNTCANLNSTTVANFGCADSGGSPSCSLTVNDSALVRCPLTYTATNTLPAGGGTYVNACETMQTEVVLTNNDENAVATLDTVLTIPPDFFFVSATSSGVYNAAAHTVTFPTLASLAGGGNQSYTIEIKPSCNGLSQQSVATSINYESPVQTVTEPDSDPIDARVPVINVSLEDAAIPGATTILATRGTTVTFKLKVLNTGNGDLLSGADLDFTPEAGLTAFVFKDSGGTAFTPTLTAGTYEWNSGAVAANSTEFFTVEMLVNSCENLDMAAASEYGCADDGGLNPCSNTSSTEASITLLLETPNISIGKSTIAVDWCAGDLATFPVTNIGGGPARNVKINIIGFDLTNLEITPTVNSDFSYNNNGGVAEFTLISGDDTDNDGTTDDLDDGSVATLEFTIGVISTTGCAASGGGTLVCEMAYQDDCDVVLNAGTGVGSYSVGARPEVTITKTGPAFVDLGDQVTYTVTMTNTHTSDIDVELVDDYPDINDTPSSFGNFTFSSSTQSGSVDNGNTVSWTGANAITVPAGGNVSFDIVLNSPTNSCAGGNSYTNTATMSFTATDCNSCPIPGDGVSDQVTTFVNNTSGVDIIIDDHTRTVSYTNFNSNDRDQTTVTDRGETCAVTQSPAGTTTINGDVNLSATVDFGTAGSVPGTWANTDGAGNNMTFVENLNNNLEIPAKVNAPDTLKEQLNLTVEYDGTDVTANVTVTDNSPNDFTIDLSGIDGTGAGVPSDGKILEISYVLYAPEAAAGTFIGVHTLNVPNSTGGCGATVPTEFDQGVNTRITSSLAESAVTKVSTPNFIDKCETATYRVTVSNDEPWTMYDVQVQLDLGGNYESSLALGPTDFTISFNGFTDETGAAITPPATSRVGDVLSWNFGDLRTGGTIDIELIKICDTNSTALASTVFSNPNCNNLPETPFTAGTNSNIDNYSATVLRIGEMEIDLVPETFFSTTGYPVMRFYVINSGNGQLVNMSVPLNFGADLEFLSATNTAPAGTTVTPTVTDLQNVTFTINQLDAGEQLFVDMNLRLVGCLNLNVNVVNAVWGCKGETTSCQANLPLNQTSVVAQPSSNVIVAEHTGSPKFIDFCGSPATFNVKVSNDGITEVYEAIIVEDLPPGLILLGTPEYRFDEDGDGNFDNPSAPGFDTFPHTDNGTSPATVGVTDYDKTNGMVIWNFMDPDNNGNESDSIFTTTDGHEADGDGLRHIVMKPGSEVEIRFRVNIPTCADAVAYENGNRQTKAEIQFDQPCDHANPLDPLTSSGLNFLVELPAEANVDIIKTGKNNTGAPWDTSFVGTEVRGETGQSLTWRMKLTSNGDGAAAAVTLTEQLPTNLQYDSFSVVAGGTDTSAGVTMTLVSDSGSPGNTLEFAVFNSNLTDDPLTTVDEQTFLLENEFITIDVVTTLVGCEDLTQNTATVAWGCCQPPETGPPGSNGENIATVDLKTIPDDPVIILAESGAFNTCGGSITATVQNPNTDFTVYGFDLSIPVPAGFAYDASGDGTDFAYSGTGARVAMDQFSAGEEEPDATDLPGTLRWHVGGNIPATEDILNPDETLTIAFNLKADGTSCDSNTNSVSTDDPDRNDNDATDPLDVPPAIADFTATFTGAFEDSCSAAFANAVSVNTSVGPEQPDLDITLTPNIDFIDNATASIVWTLVLENKGDAAATNIEFTLNLGDGYSSASKTTGSPNPDSGTSTTSPGNDFTWNRGSIATIAGGASVTWTFTGTINTTTRGDLNASASVQGYCVDAGGTDVCTYSDDAVSAFISGASISKVIDGTELNTPAVSTDPGAANANAIAADAVPGSIIRQVITVELFEGGSTDLVIRDVLPAGMEFLEGNVRVGAGAWSNLTPGVGGTTYSFSGGALSGITGGALITGGTEIILEVWVRLDDNTGTVLEGGSLQNTAQLTVSRGSATFDHTTNSLSDTTEVTVLEPHIQDDADYTKTSNPASLASDHTGGAALNLAAKGSGGDNPVEYTFTAKNTGTSPAFELEFTDLIPFGVADPTAQPSPFDLVVTITPMAAAARTLTTPADYSALFTAEASGTGTAGEFVITLKNTANGLLDVNETLTIKYSGQIVSAAPGAFIDNAGEITGYSSLPGSGAAETTGNGTGFNESDDERTSYADTFRDVPAEQTYHFISGVLTSTKEVQSEVTLADSGGAIQFRGDPDTDTRAAIGELMTYQARLNIPFGSTVYNPRFTDTLPDGLTVESVKWELVAQGTQFTGGETDYSANIPAEVNGATPLVIVGDGVGNNFPVSLAGGAAGMDLLVEIKATVDEELFDGTDIVQTSIITNGATFQWALFNGGTLSGSSTVPNVEFTVLEPALGSLTKARTGYFESDGTTSATSPGTATYANFNAQGPDNPNPPPTDPVMSVFQVRPTEIIEYTITVQNTGGARAYDVNLIDTFPVGTSFVSAGVNAPTISTAPTGGSAFAAGPTAVGQSLQMTIDFIEPDDTLTVTYRLQVDTGAAAGRYLQNQIDLGDYGTLPGTAAFPDRERDTDSTVPFSDLGPFFEKVGTEFPTTSKTVESEFTVPAGKLSDGTGRGSIGELMTYEILIDIADDLTLFDFVFSDVIPDGLTVRLAEVILAPAVPTGTTNMTVVNNANGTTTISNSIGDTAAVNGTANDITVIITATVDEAFVSATGATDNGPFGVGAANGIVDGADVFGNNADLSWNQVDDTATANTQTAAASNINFTVLEPDFKAADFDKVLVTAATQGTGTLVNPYGEGPDTPSNPVTNVPLFSPTETIVFDITFENTGTTTAYDIEITDRVPEGLAFISAALTPATSAFTVSALASGDINVVEVRTYTIDKLDAGATGTLTVTMDIASPISDGRYLQNRADLTDYDTLPTGAAFDGASEERDTDSTQPYSNLGPQYAAAGIPQSPVFSKTIETELTPPSGKNSDGSTRAAIGELITYEILIDIPDDEALYDFFLDDQLPDGLTLETGATETFVQFRTGGNTETVTTTANAFGEIITSGRRVGVILNDPVAEAGFTNEIIIRIGATVNQKFDSTTDIVAGNTLVNDFTFSWNQVDEDPDPTVNFAADDRQTTNFVTLSTAGPAATTDFTVVEPLIDVSVAGSFAKTLSNITSGGTRGTDTFYNYPAAGGGPVEVSGVEVVRALDTLEYRISVTNTGTSPAFDIVVRDILPPDSELTYTSGSGAGFTGTYSGSTNSVLSAIATTVAIDSENHTQLDFNVDFLEDGESFTIDYQVTVVAGTGAAHYIGNNDADLLDHGSLPDGTFLVNVGNLISGNSVFDNSRERDSDSDPAYADQSEALDIGVEWPVIDKKVFKLYDDEGDLLGAPAELAGTDRVRIGDILRYQITISLPIRSSLFDGQASGSSSSHLAIEDLLPLGFKLRSDSETFNFGGTLTGAHIDNTGADVSTGSGSPIDLATATQQKWRWLFRDIVNTDNAADDFVFTFDIDATDKNPAGTVAHHLSPSAVDDILANHVVLFWDSADVTSPGPPSPQKGDFNETDTTGDEPFLTDDSAKPLVTQPQITCVKTVYNFNAGGTGPAFLGTQLNDNDLIGVTDSAGDVLVYQIEFENTGSAGSNNAAYDISVTDTLPVALRPASLTGDATDLSGANNFIADIDGVVLNPANDYTLTYTSPTVPPPGANEGRFVFTTTHDGTSYDSKVGNGEKLTVSYKVVLDENVGASGGGFGQRINKAEIAYLGFPDSHADESLLTTNGTDPFQVKSYTESDKRISLILDIPGVEKIAQAPFPSGSSVEAADTIEYTIAAPHPPIRADMYDVEIFDELPDGMELPAGATTTVTAAAGTVTLDIDGDLNDDVIVTGGSGNVTINVTGTNNRNVQVLVDKINNRDTALDDFGPTVDGWTNIDGGTADTDSDQVVVTIKAVVNSVFDSGIAIQRLHQFDNVAQFFWYDDDSPEILNAAPTRFAALSGTVSHFFDAEGILFEPSHTSIGQRATVKLYRHFLRNFDDAAEDVTLTYTTTEGWPWQIFLGDGNGNLVTGPFASGHVVSVPAGGVQEIIMRTFIPDDAPNFTTDVLTVTATAPGVNTITVTDVTVIQSEQVVVVKDISDDGGGNFDTRLTVDPDDPDFILQRLRFVNQGSSNVKEIFIYDFMPDYTVYVANSAVNDGDFELQFSTDGGVTWTVGEPAATETVVSGTVPSVTNLRWRYTKNGGVLVPGLEETLTFKIKVE